MPEDGTGVKDTVSSFKRNGFVFPIQLFSPEEATFYRRKYDESPCRQPLPNIPPGHNFF